jgi:hypothetical protein
MIGPGFAEAVIGEMFKRILPWLIAVVLILFGAGVAVGWLI